MRKAPMTYWSDWTLPVDKAAAREAYERGCAANSVRACAALVERHCLDGEPAEKQRIVSLLRSEGVEPRSDAEVAQADATLEQLNRGEEAHFKGLQSAAWSATFQQLSQLQLTGKPGHLELLTPEQAQAREQLLRIIEPPLHMIATAGKPATKAGSKSAAATTPASPASPGRPGPAGAGTSPAPQQQPATGVDDDTAKQLAACLAQPGPQMRTAQTNPFQSYVTQYQSLLEEAGKCPDTGAAWRDCIGMNARIWPDSEAQRDETDFNSRFNAVVSFMPAGPSACLYNQSIGTTRSFCSTMSQAACQQRLQQNIADLQCSLTVLPRVWEGEMSRNDADAKQKQDDDCRRRFR
jgi:hypothetical protein